MHAKKKKLASFDWPFNHEINLLERWRVLSGFFYLRTCILSLSFFCLWFLQESVEALPSSESMSFPAGLPCLHGLHDLPVLPYGLLAAHNHLLQHPHVTAGTQTSHSNTNEQSLSQHIDTPVVSSFVNRWSGIVVNISWFLWWLGMHNIHY